MSSLVFHIDFRTDSLAEHTLYLTSDITSEFIDIPLTLVQYQKLHKIYERELKASQKILLRRRKRYEVDSKK